MNKQGGPDPAQNIFKADLSKQQDADTDAWYAPSVNNIVQQDGQHIVIKPDNACGVKFRPWLDPRRSMAEMSFSRARAT